jgi:hypothetical protein
MPRLAAYFLRSALFCMLLGFTFGSLLLANKGVPFSPLAWMLLPSHIELVIAGWLSQLALGTVFWILPRIAGSAPRGDERWSWAAFWLLQAGLLAGLLAPFLPEIPHGMAIARALEACAFAAFAIGNWARVYPFQVPNWAKRT